MKKLRQAPAPVAKKHRLFYNGKSKAGLLCFFILNLIIGGIIFAAVSLGQSAAVNDFKSNLQKDLQTIESQINEYRDRISAAQNETKTLNREIQLLGNKIKQSELEIKQTELVIQQTQLGINEKGDEIQAQELKLGREKILLAQYLQGIHEFDQESMVELIFSQKSLSGIFSEFNALETIQQKTYETITQIREIKDSLEAEKDDLTQKKEEEVQLKALQLAQRAGLAAQQKQNKDLLAQTKGQESAFQKLLQKAKSDATAIKKQIYMLEGVGLSMTLEEAYNHAKFAADRTGVRPAFLLAVLKQESSWGTNVGTGTWKKDMRPIDQKAFVQICDELNLDPDKMPVSRKPSYGWGGAMGPAQFLPSTWLAYKDQIAKATGHNPPSPWDIDDAFTASAIKLAKDGASQRTSDTEWKAAMIYFAGSNWGKKVYSFYGDSVMELAEIIQGQLDIITK
jgi:membrane-bound lytic murein transglycosylase B